MRPVPDEPVLEESLPSRSRRVPLLNLPKLLTHGRIILVPFFAAMIVQGKAFEALLIIVAAGVTDVLDGWAARATRQKTKAGSFLDPAADKLLMMTSFILLTLPKLGKPNVIPLWLTVVVIGRDVIIACGALALIALRKLGRVRATILGKSSTVCQVLTVWAVVLFNYLRRTPTVMPWLYFLTLMFTSLSGIQYVLIGIRSLKNKASGKG
jgi:cardiolipin synthase